MPTQTGYLLVLYGHGAVTTETFNFQRSAASKVNLYSWTAEGIPIFDTQAQLIADDALIDGKIHMPYAKLNQSRIGGQSIKDQILSPIEEPDVRLPHVPAGYHTTDIPALGASVQHNGTTLANSNRMLLMVKSGEGSIRFSDVLNSPQFAARTFDAIWCACRVEG